MEQASPHPYCGPYSDPAECQHRGSLPPPEATLQPTSSKATTIPWKRIGFEVLLLTNLLVKLESTYVVGMGSSSMAIEGGRMTGITAISDQAFPHPLTQSGV